MDVNPEGKPEGQVAAEGLARMETYMKDIGLVMTLRDLGVTPDMLGDIAKSISATSGGYNKLNQD